jgi:hypothetical protein
VANLSDEPEKSLGYLSLLSSGYENNTRHCIRFLLTLAGAIVFARSLGRDEAQQTQVTTGYPIVTGANERTVVSIDPEQRLTLTLNEDGYGPSDHSSFYAKHVPVLFFWTGNHEDYLKITPAPRKP